MWEFRIVSDGVGRAGGAGFARNARFDGYFNLRQPPVTRERFRIRR